VSKTAQPQSKRPYELGKRLEQMDQSRADILRAARAQLEEKGYRQLTMGSLADASGVTRQTIHNLFGTKSAVLEALFDVIALDGGMQNMASIMTQASGERMLEQFVHLFCGFWSKNRLLLRRVHGIGAIDLEFGAVLSARNERRLMAATRIVRMLGVTRQANQSAATLSALTSFEFYDALSGDGSDPASIEAVILQLATGALSQHAQDSLRA
jgi:AcrR family transcriptional regulator